MHSLKKEVMTIFVLFVVAVIGIYVANAEITRPDGENRILTASEITISASDTKAGHYPCKIPSTQRQLCNQSGIGCKAWAVYDACVDGSPYCD